MDITQLVLAILPRAWTSWTVRLLAVAAMVAVALLGVGRTLAGATPASPQRYLDKVFGSTRTSSASASPAARAR